ncbi:sigma factor-like helix-turn-helix DNA-binding protein [Nocardioides sp. B-3]|uniref:sigma factor-like helix-turn-helix DNA-binding protein n=1 Tax=Nocardioides sp. B-3 TaxID=2895565 RepID=UPI003FA5E00F
MPDGAGCGATAPTPTSTGRWSTATSTASGAVLPVPVETVAETADAASTDLVDARSELTELLAPLSPRERSIVVWRYYLDASEQDVARALGVSAGTVKSTASRALARLRSAHTTSTRESR